MKSSDPKLPDSTEGPEISLVVPVLNEAGQLASLIDEIRSVLLANGTRFEVIVCDDGSDDRTWPVVQEKSRAHADVHGISLSRHFGKESAVLAGLTASRGQAVAVMDGDGQHPPAVLPEMIAAWRGGADVVEGIKTRRSGQRGLVRWAAQAFNRIFSTLTGVDLINATDYRVLDRKVVDSLLQMPERVVFFRGLSTWVGFRRARVEFEPRRRTAGRSHFSLPGLFGYGVRNLLSFSSAPLHLVTLLGCAFGLFAIVLGAQTLWNWARGFAVEGFTTVILLLLVQGSAMMIALGMIGLYLAQIHREVKHRPRYIIAESTHGLDGRVFGQD
ncbi:MAG: glycosyltransferase family 2 protein [Wenzhouxiangellaceae bacterium]|nr:glycosyltransferase family 2 protein [Wenzhouxiangellaceae bacterium]